MPIYDRLSLRADVRGEGDVWLPVWNALVMNRAVSCVAEMHNGYAHRMVRLSPETLEA